MNIQHVYAKGLVGLENLKMLWAFRLPRGTIPLLLRPYKGARSIPRNENKSKMLVSINYHAKLPTSQEHHTSTNTRSYTNNNLNYYSFDYFLGIFGFLNEQG